MSKARRSRSAIVLLLVGVFAAWWGVAAFTQTSTSVLPPANPNSAAAYASDPILLHSTVINGTASYSGEISLPSACDVLGTGIAAKGDNPAHVTILFTLSQPQTGCAAAQSPISASFAVSVAIMHGAHNPILDGVTVNGIIVPIRIIQSQ